MRGVSCCGLMSKKECQERDIECTTQQIRFFVRMRHRRKLFCKSTMGFPLTARVSLARYHPICYNKAAS